MSEREPQRQRMILTEDGELLGIEPEECLIEHDVARSDVDRHILTF